MLPLMYELAFLRTAVENGPDDGQRLWMNMTGMCVCMHVCVCVYI